MCIRDSLRADPDKLEEIIKMKENDRRHIDRKSVV